MPLYNSSEVFEPGKQISKHFLQFLDIKKTERNALCALVYFWSHVRELSLLFQAIHLNARSDWPLY